MIAIYARQSVDKPDSISIDSQIEYCSYEAKGKCFVTYVDKGYSGKDTNRPEFTRMVSDIKSGKIDSVIVYKLDRISRSILDFSNLMQLFEQYNVDFISSTEKFDTSTPMGRAMLNICIVFAQLERETIQKRVADAYLARLQKSLYMGGRIPFGFCKVPTIINGVHTSMYKCVPDESAVVKRIYELYSKEHCSLGDIARHFASIGVTRRGKGWERARIRDIIINPIYVKANTEIYNFFLANGAEIINNECDFIGTNGCYLYSNSSSKSKKRSGINGNILVIAPHEGMIDSSIWLRCRKKCMRKVNKKIKCLDWLTGKFLNQHNTICDLCAVNLYIAKQLLNRLTNIFTLLGLDWELTFNENVWNRIDLAEKKQIAETFIQSVELTDDDVKINWMI